MSTVTKLSYINQGATAGAQIGPVGPRGLYSITCTLVGGAVTVYDGTSTGGTILFTKTLAVGDIITWGGHGLAAKAGLFAAVTAATVNIAYT